MERSEPCERESARSGKSKSALRPPADEAGDDHSSPPPPRRVLGCSRDLAVRVLELPLLAAAA